MKNPTPKEKAHTDNGMDFFTLLANYKNATLQQIAFSEVLCSLAQVNEPNKFKFINDNIFVDNVEKPTANSIAYITSSPSNPQSNLAIFPMNGGEPFLLHGFNNDGFTLGNGEQKIIALDQEQAFLLMAMAKANDTNHKYTIIFPLNERHFTSLVKAHAKHGNVWVFDMLANREKLEKDFKSDNVKLILTVAGMIDLTDFAISEIMDNPNDDPLLSTKIIDCGKTEWGEIEPLRDDESTPANQYPINAFTGVLRGAVEAVAYHAQVQLSMAGQCILGVLSVLGQKYVNAPFGHSHIPTNLFLLTEAESSAGKTVAKTLAYYAIEQYEQQAYQDFARDIQEYISQRNSLRGKELKEFLQSEIPPTNPKMIVDDITIESVLDRFVMGTSTNLSWASDDAGTFFGGYSMKSDNVANVIANLTTLWSKGTVHRERSQRTTNATPLTTAYNVRLTMDLAGQREILEPVLTNRLMNGQGFLARFLFTCEPSLIGNRVWNSKERLSLSPYDDPRLIEFWQMCKILIDPPPPRQPTRENRFNMPFADGAMQYLANYQQFVETRQRQGNELEFFRAVAGRMAENATRIATLMAFFNGEQALSIEYLQQAVKLVEYSTAERLRYLDIKPKEPTDVEKLLEWLVKKCKAKKVDKLNWSFIYHNAPNGLQKKSKLLKEILEVLESGNHIIMTKDGKATIIAINTHLLK